MASSVKQMIEAANAVVPRISRAQADELIRKGALVVDVRDAPEVEKNGKVAGAVHVSRGMLEFRADPESPYHDKQFDRARTVIVYCASGGRSALSGKTLKDLGYETVYNLGAFKDWAEVGRRGGKAHRTRHVRPRTGPYWLRKSPHFGACSLPHGMSGTVDVEFCGEPSISRSVYAR